MDDIKAKKEILNGFHVASIKSSQTVDTSRALCPLGYKFIILAFVANFKQS